MSKSIRIAIAGNPNSGKTTVFNALTGARQHVANYPGVTVEKKTGRFRHGDAEVEVVDLPGTYSLTAYTLEELIARNFIVDDKPDLVVNIVDCSNIERNLYLTVQMIELGAPLVIVLNMSDVAHARGIEFDMEMLSELLGAQVVPTAGNRGVGIKELKDAVVGAAAEGSSRKQPEVKYGREVEEELAKLAALVASEEADLAAKYGARWVALKLLENDLDVTKRASSEKLLAAVEHSARHLTRVFGDNPEIVIADRRYGFISGAVQEAVKSTVEARHTMSDKIDELLTHRALGLPLFLALMYLVFQLTFTLGEPPMEWIEAMFGWLGGTVAGFWPSGSESPLRSLLVDGIIGGVGGVIVFLPNIVFLFLAIAILEDSGYMARAAFIMDRYMHRIGLHGKSFIPMLVGFGCSVPAIMATRTLESRRDRLTTMLVTPLMSCGARFPIYALIIPAFFPSAWRGPMLWLIYVIGIVLAVLSAKVLRVTVLRGESNPLVMELPPYRVPTARGVCIHVWERSKMYLKKAGTLILGASVVLWAITAYPKKQQLSVDYEAQIVSAREAHDEAVEELAADLGAPERGRALAEWLMDASRTGEASKPSDKPTVLGVGPDGYSSDPLERFLEVHGRLMSIRDEFRETVETHELRETSAAYMIAQGRRDLGLAQLERAAPEAYRAAVRYVDGIRQRHDSTVAALRKLRQKEILTYTIAGRIGTGMEPVLKPMGFDWRIGTALIGALAAKEVFVSQLGIVFAIGEATGQRDALRHELQASYSPLVGFCIMLFCLVSAPCVATVAVTRQESGTWRWALFMLGGLTAMAYALTVVVYQAGSLLGLGT